MTETKGSSFWATVPGLITAVAILITALAPLLASDPQGFDGEVPRADRSGLGQR